MSLPIDNRGPDRGCAVDARLLELFTVALDGSERATNRRTRKGSAYDSIEQGPEKWNSARQRQLGSELRSRRPLVTECVSLVEVEGAQSN